MNTASNATRTTPSATYKWGVIFLGNSLPVQLGWFKTKRQSEGFALTQVQRGNYAREHLATARWYGA